MKDLNRILFRNELKALAGRSFNAVFALIVILFFTIMVFGIAAGSMKDLKKKMDNPFTNWIDINVTNSVGSQLKDIHAHFDNKEQKSRFSLANISEYDMRFQRFILADGSDEIPFRGRSVTPEEPIVQAVLENNICINGTLQNEPCGIIVTEELLNKLGYNNSICSITRIPFPFHNKIIYVRVLAVVSVLPNRCNWFYTPILLRMLHEPLPKTNFIVESNNNVSLISHSGKVSDGQAIITEALKEYDPVTVRHMDSLIIIEGKASHIYNVSFSPIRARPSSDTVMAALQGTGIEVYTKTNCNTSKSSISSPDNMAFQFKGLSAIRPFRDEMAQTFDIEVSMQQIEASDNFHLVSLMTSTISIVLFGFAALSVSFYITSLIRTHITKSAPNLGTLKAFGVEDGQLNKIYVAIIGLFCTIAAFIALILSFIVQLILNKIDRIPLKLDVLDPILLLSLVAIICLCLILASRTANRLLIHTPGDLVYRRI